MSCERRRDEDTIELLAEVNSAKIRVEEVKLPSFHLKEFAALN